MSLGELAFPIGYVPLNTNGEPVPSGKLTFSRTGTATAQDSYSDSALTVANSNPVVLDSSGMLTTKVYLDPTTGFDYRIKFSTSADAQIWVFDDVVVPSRDLATIVEGSFTATLTGMTAATTGTVNYTITADDEGAGKICTLHARAAITGTSNTTALTLTGLPAACTPNEAVLVLVAITDNTAAVQGGAQITADDTTITFSCDTPLSVTGFTNSGTKGLSAGWSMSYPLAN
jgi:hypothetical protein